MDPLTVPLALGCALIFSHLDPKLTEQSGAVPDGVFYRSVALRDANGRQHVLEHPRPGQGFSPGADFRVGPSPDGLFASYLYSEQAAQHTVQDIRFVSARSCAAVHFVRARDGANIGGDAYRGWLPDAPHSVRVWRDSREYDVGLPIDEARRANPAIKD